MNFELLRVLIAVAGTALAAWQDHKTSFIDDKIVYSMIGAGIVLDLLTFDYAFILSVLPVALAVGVIGFISYKAGQFGGGDVLLLLGLQFLLPFYPYSLGSPYAYPSFLPFLLSVFVAASFLASAGSTLWYASSLRKAGGGKGRWAYFAAAALASIPVLFFVHLPLPVSLFMLVLWVSLVFFLFFKQDVMKLVVVKKLRVNEMEDEDVLALDDFPKGLAEKYGLGRVLTEEMRKKLLAVQKKEGIASFPVCKTLPRFGPYVLLGLLLCLVVVDLIFFLFLA